MIPKSRTIRRSPYLNTLLDSARKLDELIGAQSLARRSNVKSDKAYTKTYTPPKTLTLSLIPFFAKNLFTKFMKVFKKTMQTWDQEQFEPRERLLKAKTPEISFGKLHIECYHFY